MGLIAIGMAENKRLEKLFRNMLYGMRAASSQVLNDLAFDAREYMPTYLSTVMTIRAKPFVKRSFRVTKSTPSSQRALMGSVRTARFSGWVEQETGAKTARTRVSTLLGRSKKRAGKIAPKSRMARGKDFPKPSDYASKNGNAEHQVAHMLRALGKKNYKGAFILPKRAGKTSGLYRFGRKRKGLKRVVMVQNLDSKNAQPKRIPWASRGTDRFMKKVHLESYWHLAIAKTMARKR